MAGPVRNGASTRAGAENHMHTGAKSEAQAGAEHGMQRGARARAEQEPLLVWLGLPYFSDEMRANGFRLCYLPFCHGQVFHWQDILRATNGECPSLLVVSDVSCPPFVLGVEDFPCLTAFFVVDSHVQSWYPIYAQAFDLALITLKEHLPNFAKGRLDASRLLWSPPFAQERHQPPEPMPEKEWDLVFAGTVLRERNPKRCDFLTRLKERFPALYITGEPFAEMYPRSKLVLNESAGELNYRVFEALSHKSCLLTPDIGPAVRDFFLDGQELFLYPPHDVEAVVRLAERLLADRPLRKRVAEAGFDAVNARHRGRHRAAAAAAWLHAFLDSGQAKSMIAHRLAAAPAIRAELLRLLYLHHAETVEYDGLRAVYLAAARTCTA